MIRENNKTANEMKKRLTAILVAVVFVFGTAFIPCDIYAVESGNQSETVAEETAEDITGTDAAVSDVSAEDPDNEILGNEKTQAEESNVQGNENSVTEMTGLVSATDENGNGVDLGEIDGSTYEGFIYKVKDDTTNTEIREMEKAIDNLDSKQEVEEILEKELYTADSIETIAEVAEPEQIESIEPNFIMTACAAPNDPGYSAYAWQMEMTNIPYAWDRGMTGAGAVVAVLDSGVNINHKDLAGVSFVKNYNCIDGSTNVIDNFGHGTKVTGVIVEARNNGIGFTGAMSNASIMPVKILSDNGSTSVSTAIKGIDYAMDKKADVINMSFGGNFQGLSSAYLEEACKTAVDNGAILVAAAGNEAKSKDQSTGGVNPIMYPAAYDCVVSVGAVDKNAEHSWFSTYNDQVSVVAPGENVILLSGTSEYYTDSGTSFSAPQVSALAAMMKSRDHSVRQEEFMELLRTTSTDLGDEGRDDYYGYGLINYSKVFDYMATKFSNYSVTLSSGVFDYDGNTKSPGTTVSLGTVKLTKGTDYSVVYASGRKAVGKYKVTVNGINDFSGTKTTDFTIRPPLVKGIKAPKRLKKKLTVRWTAMSKTQKKKYKNVITGYQVRVSTKSNFTGAKYAKVKGYTKTSATVKGLKGKTTYYVQYRSYKTVGSTTYYSKWSGTKKAKTK